MYGILNLPWWGNILAVLIIGHITIIAVTIYLHRCQAHRSLALHPILSHFFRFWLWLTTGMGTKEWVAIHRKHHAFTETQDDPHSPVIYGIKKVLLEGAELYRQEKSNKETMERFGRGTPDDWLERNVYSLSFSYGIFLLLGLYLLLFGIPAITMWALQMLCIPFFAAGVINGLGHYIGYRNFACPDQSRNISIWGILAGGEELHNNHHAFPGSAKLSVKWWEFDIGWVYIRLFQFLRLAKVYRLPPKVKSISQRTTIDAETVSVIIANRFHLATEYSKTVLLPLLKEEKSRIGQVSVEFFRQAKKILVKGDEPNSKYLSLILEKCEKLNTAYQLQQKLQSIWNHVSSNQKERLEALQEWCKQAEESGIEVLHQFVARLKTYVLVPEKLSPIEAV
jgi:stearoyl-CoA desaturase (delta-9 desaturase)